jgi:hypothetical protein
MKGVGHHDPSGGAISGILQGVGRQFRDPGSRYDANGAIALVHLAMAIVRDADGGK